MKKKILWMLVICWTTGIQLASAQSAELQQLALDIEKLTQFKQILTDMKNGYQVIDYGYGTIKGISKGTFDLHSGFLNGLMLVSPSVRNYSRVAAIISMQTSILSEYKTAFSRFKSGGRFNPAEIDYMGKVYSNLFNRSIYNLGELTMILTDSKLRMSDDERIAGIDRIDRQMQEKLSFLRYFNNQASAVDGQRKAAQTQNSQLQQLYGR